VLKLDNKYYAVSDVENNRFYQLPKALIENEKYDDLHSTAKIIYSILKDRHSLSVMNGWVDDRGVFFMFKDDALAELLRMTRRTANKYKKELEKYGLIEMHRTGLNQPNKIYLCKPESVLGKPETLGAERKRKNVHIQSGKNVPIQKRKNVPIKTGKNVLTNHTELNHTEKNDTEYNHHPIIESFNQEQSNLLHEVIKEQKIDDDLQGKLFIRLQGKNFKHKAYILKALESTKNEVSATYSSGSTRVVKAPAYITQPNFEHVETYDDLQHKLDRLEESLNAGTITKEQYEQDKDFYLSLYPTDDTDEKRAW
jgi:Replication initiator protein A (RepA) N-terminus